MKDGKLFSYRKLSIAFGAVAFVVGLAIVELFHGHSCIQRPKLSDDKEVSLFIVGMILVCVGALFLTRLLEKGKVRDSEYRDLEKQGGGRLVKALTPKRLRFFDLQANLRKLLIFALVGGAFFLYYYFRSR